MKIIQLIKSFFNSIKKVKRLNDPGLEYAEGTGSISNSLSVLKSAENESNNYELFENTLNSNSSKTEKVVDILKSIGCTDENLIGNPNYEDLDIQNFKANIDDLSSLKPSKLELAFALSGNYDLLYEENIIINKGISALKKWIDDDEIVKNIVSNNSRVINSETEENIDRVYKTMQENQISRDMIKYILDDNPYILVMDNNRLSDSLKTIRSCFDSQKEFESEIIGNAFLVGLLDLNTIKEQIS